MHALGRLLPSGGIEWKIGEKAEDSTFGVATTSRPGEANEAEEV